MSFTWKDTVATISVIIALAFTAALTLGLFDTIEGRWALGTFALFLLGGVSGLITGTAKMMQRPWSAIILYVLSAGALIITLANAFLNSEAWFVAMTSVIVLIWVELVGVDLLLLNKGSRPSIPQGGAHNF